MIPPCSARRPDFDGLEVLRKVYPGIGTLHNNSDLVDLRDLNGGTTAAADLMELRDGCLLLRHFLAHADLE